jgi:hypothetical protein
MRGARRRWHRSHLRAPQDVSVTPDADSRDVAELLDNVHRLRLTLAADLATAASALDADEPAIARDILAADAAEVRRLADPVAAAPQPSRSARRRRALLALPAIPLMGALAMTGAAAFSGGSTSAAPGAGQRQTQPVARHTPQQISRTATSALQQLERAMSRHSHAGRVVALAAHLHQQLTALIETSANDPARLGEVQHLLTVEQQLLEKQTGEGAAIALAASRKVTHLLRISGLTTDSAATSPAVIATSTSTSRSTQPSAKPTRKTTPTPPSSAKPRPPTSSPPAALPGTTPRPPHTRHRHRHHNGLPQPLGQSGLINQAP